MTETITRRGKGLWRIPMWGLVAAALITPAVAMRFTSEVKWTASDFVFAGVVLGGAALIIELVVWRAKSMAYRAGVALSVLASVLLVWITGAVGVIGTEEHPANLLFLGVIGAAFLGSLISGLRAKGMSRAAFVAAVLQALIGIVALGAGWGSSDPGWPLDIVASTGVFTALWLAAAVLFGKAAETP